jgi:trk system potassium uptake protein TrkA
MNYVIIGCGRVGSRLAKLLTEEGHDVTVVDENPAAFKRLGHHFPGRVEVGTGIDYDVLRRAGAEGADGFIAVTDGDNRNVMAALIAQRMFGIKKIIARIYDPPRGEMYRELGIETVCPTTLGAQIIRQKLRSAPGAEHHAFDFGVVSSLSVRLTTEHAGMRIADLEIEGRVRVAAWRRGESVNLPRASDVLAAGDEINAVVTPDALSAFIAQFSAAPIKLTA